MLHQKAAFVDWISVVNKEVYASLPPREHQTRRNAVPSRDLRHHRAGCQRLLDDPHLVVARPATATLNPAQNFYPHQPTLRLALKPYASSQTGHRIRRPAAKGYDQGGLS